MFARYIHTNFDVADLKNVVVLLHTVLPNDFFYLVIFLWVYWKPPQKPMADKNVSNKYLKFNCMIVEITVLELSAASFQATILQGLLWSNCYFLSSAIMHADWKRTSSQNSTLKLLCSHPGSKKVAKAVSELSSILCDLDSHHKEFSLCLFYSFQVPLSHFISLSSISHPKLLCPQCPYWWGID